MIDFHKLYAFVPRGTKQLNASHSSYLGEFNCSSSIFQPKKCLRVYTVVFWGTISVKSRTYRRIVYKVPEILKKQASLFP